MDHESEGLIFEWDPAKAERNLKKHGISFEEASTIFGDPLSRTIHDPDHSADEDRFVTIGYAATGRLLLAVHADRGDHIRIISSRQASPRERRQHEQHPSN